MYMTGVMVFISEGSDYSDDVRCYETGSSIDFTGTVSGLNDHYVVEALENKLDVHMFYRKDKKEFKYLGLVDYNFQHQIIPRGEAEDTFMMRFKVVTSLPEYSRRVCDKKDLPIGNTYGYKNGCAHFLGLSDKLLITPASAYWKCFVPFDEFKDGSV